MSNSQADRLRSKIEADILSYRLKPGDRLDESKLAERYGTSRTPVREALRQLSSNGLIEIRPHKGAIVAKMGIRELLELMEVMAELEGACGRLAAKACLAGDLEALLEAQNECRRLAEKNDVEGYQKANDAFHEVIYDASRNGSLSKMTISLRNRVGPFRRLQLSEQAHLGSSVTQHDEIVRAIQNGLADDADRLLQKHILDMSGEIRRLMSIVSSGAGSPGSMDGQIQFEKLPVFENVPVK
jgi:DNA-binding GntR family transcriptional regulator